jgi:hypothetical protein
MRSQVVDVLPRGTVAPFLANFLNYPADRARVLVLWAKVPAFSVDLSFVVQMLCKEQVA